ncbi:MULTISPECIES: YbaB/EbfC family nucleoid-associated protein [unclassified Streptomyces]|uniref:YbaB/EbfC family nucleoid-associated protein n=1 Tax=unclassified Streptomyces TaxID=2593676 RepID=UPI0036E36F93
MSGATAGAPDDTGRGEVSPYARSVEARLAQAMAELEATQNAAAAADAELRRTSRTVRSDDRSVEVTVGPQGELTDLRFLDGKYRTMAPAELAGSVLGAFGRARTEIAREVMQALEPLTRPSTSVPELTGVDIDWAKVFGPEVLEEPDDRAGRDAGRRLRDEIDEDQED